MKDLSRAKKHTIIYQIAAGYVLTFQY